MFNIFFLYQFLPQKHEGGWTRRARFPPALPLKLPPGLVRKGGPPPSPCRECSLRDDQGPQDPPPRRSPRAWAALSGRRWDAARTPDGGGKSRSQETRAREGPCGRPTTVLRHCSTETTRLHSWALRPGLIIFTRPLEDDAFGFLQLFETRKAPSVRHSNKQAGAGALSARVQL